MMYPSPSTVDFVLIVGFVTPAYLIMLLLYLSPHLLGHYIFFHVPKLRTGLASHR